MALISCPECGKEISNKSQTCIYCGCPIHGVHNVTQIKETSKINKRVWVAALVFICVAALVVLTIGISANTLNGEEKHVLKLVEEYQSMLKDPDSLILRGSVVVSVNIPTKRGRWSMYSLLPAAQIATAQK